MTISIMLPLPIDEWSTSGANTIFSQRTTNHKEGAFMVVLFDGSCGLLGLLFLGLLGQVCHVFLNTLLLCQLTTSLNLQLFSLASNSSQQGGR